MSPTIFRQVIIKQITHMADLQHPKKSKGNWILLILLILCSCGQGQKKESKRIYLELYGHASQHVVLKLDGKVVYSKEFAKLEDFTAQIEPIITTNDKVKITFINDNKDTSFVFSLKAKNYNFLGYSKFRKEFQFTSSDSVSFFNSKID
jgi:hypothetical protein